MNWDKIKKLSKVKLWLEEKYNHNITILPLIWGKQFWNEDTWGGAGEWFKTSLKGVYLGLPSFILPQLWELLLVWNFHLLPFNHYLKIMLFAFKGNRMSFSWL